MTEKTGDVGPKKEKRANKKRREEHMTRDDDVLSTVSTTGTVGSDYMGALDSVVAASLDPVVCISQKGFILAVNDECLNLFGYKRWELASKNVSILMEEKISKRHDAYIKRYLRTGVKKIIGEKRDNINAIKKDGTLFPIILKVIEIPNSRFGSVFLGSIRDLSKNSELERIKTLVRTMYPQDIEKRLKSGEDDISYNYNTSVGFIDVTGFTKWSKGVSPNVVVNFLGSLFSEIDKIAESLEIIKIKLIGDCYMFTSNSSTKKFENSALKAVTFVKTVFKELGDTECFMKKILSEEEKPCAKNLGLHAGIATGEVTAGVLKGNVRMFDLFGSTVNLASRLLDCAGNNELCVCEKTEKMCEYIDDSFKKKEIYEIYGFGKINVFKMILVSNPLHNSLDLSKENLDNQLNRKSSFSKKVTLSPLPEVKSAKGRKKKNSNNSVKGGGRHPIV